MAKRIFVAGGVVPSFGEEVAASGRGHLESKGRSAAPRLLLKGFASAAADRRAASKFL